MFRARCNRPKDGASVPGSVSLLTGAIGSGKTTCAAETARLLALRGVGVDGFLSRAVFAEASGVPPATGGRSPAAPAGAAGPPSAPGRPKPAGYDLVDLASGAAQPFIRRGGGEPGWQRVGEFAFIPAALAAAERIIARGCRADVLIVDEVGPLELAGGGLRPALDRAFRTAASAQLLLVVRDSKLDEILKILPPAPAKVFNVGDPDAAPRLAASLFAAAGRRP